MTSKKVVDLIQSKEQFKFSFEVTPDLKDDDLENVDLDPTFFAVTWHAKFHQCKDLDIAPLKTASFLRSKEKQVLVNLSCDLLRKHYLERILAFLQEKDISNLFLVLGESYDPNTSDFKSTVELIKYIREISGKYFCIGVAGFCECKEEKLKNLKDKIDAGADFILTQAIFEANVYKTFRERCTQLGIDVPIIPGVFAFENYKQLINFTNMCRVKVTDNLLEYVKKHESNGNVGIEIMKELIQTIWSIDARVNFHFFTLNKLQHVCNVMKEIQK